MNNKLLFAAMSLAALTACTNDDFESQKVAEGTSPIQFEVINTNDAVTRASLKSDGVSVKWSATDGDLFTLYHGVAYETPQPVTGYQNATYTAEMSGSTATLTTPSMILPGGAIMVYPVDTVFNIKSTNNLSISIPEVLPAEKIEDHIPHVSDLVKIEDEADWTKPTAAYNKAGYKRSYPIYMRAMASQLILKADYGETEKELKKLYKGGSEQPEDGGIHEITLTSVDLLTDADGTTKFTKQIPLTFAVPTDPQGTNWNNVANHNWKQVTGVDREHAVGVPTLTTKYISGTESCRFLILPQKAITEGVKKAAIAVNTYYGKVLIAKHDDYAASKYSDDAYNKAWYRYVSAAKEATDEENASTPGTGDYATKHKVVAKNPGLGMQQTINFFGNYTAPDGSTVEGEYMGVATERFVTVDLTKLDMSDLHIKDDKQLRDVARVWKKLGLDAVTVILDGNADKEFEISQKTIEVINEVNGAYNATSNPTQKFTVKPCVVAGEQCTKIVIADGGDVQDIAFIVDADGNAETAPVANVALKAGAKWKWNGTVKVAANGVGAIINEGTMENAATAILKTTEFNEAQNDVRLVNNNIWNVTGGTLNVQFDVTNNGTLTIDEDAQYRQDGTNHVFSNMALTLPERFLAEGVVEKVGKVNNNGVFANVDGGQINNYGLIEHLKENAKTYITSNQRGGNFGNSFGGTNKMGRINLPWSNKNEDNISVSAALEQGFISVTVDGEVTGALDASVVGTKVNYVIVNSGITEIKAVSPQVKYLEIAQPGTELAWNVPETTVYTGLIVLSDVNIKLGTKIIATTTYLGADMYVGGKFNKAAIAEEAPDPAFAATNWNGYYGNTSSNVASKYITY